MLELVGLDPSYGAAEIIPSLPIQIEHREKRLRLHYTRLFPDPRFLLFVLQNIAGYKNAVECLLQ